MTVEKTISVFQLRHLSEGPAQERHYCVCTNGLSYLSCCNSPCDVCQRPIGTWRTFIIRIFLPAVVDEGCF